MKKPLLLVALVSGLVAASGLFSGCQNVPAQSYTISFVLDPALRDSTTELHLRGANDRVDLPRWTKLSLNQYWRVQNNVMRRDEDKFVLMFKPGSGADSVNSFSSANVKWTEWITRGAEHLVILADLPGAYEDQEGNADSRRLILPLNPKKWPSDTSAIVVRVKESGLFLETAMKPVK